MTALPIEESHLIRAAETLHAVEGTLDRIGGDDLEALHVEILIVIAHALLAREFAAARERGLKSG